MRFLYKILQMRTIINIVLIVVIAVVGYNYFFGNKSEKSDSQEIVNQVKDLGRSIGDLIKSEKEKMDEGKYDGVLDKARSIFDKIESQLNSRDSAQNQEFRELEHDLSDIQHKVEDTGDSTLTDQEKEELKRELQILLDKAEKLLNSTTGNHE